MSSVGPQFDDLTARARIRDAAIRLFGDRGVSDVTIREIASLAGVSGGLVRHHFGSKDDLRRACDTYALEQVVRVKEQMVLEGQLTNPGFMSSAYPGMLALYRYFARSMVDGSEAADAMFDEMVNTAQEWVERHHPGHSQDPRAFAAILIAAELGELLLRVQISRTIGADVLQAEGHLRISRAKLDFYSKPLLNEDLAAHANAALDELQRAQPAPSKRSRTRANKGPRR